MELARELASCQWEAEEPAASLAHHWGTTSGCSTKTPGQRSGADLSCSIQVKCDYGNRKSKKGEIGENLSGSLWSKSEMVQRQNMGAGDGFCRRRRKDIENRGRKRRRRKRGRVGWKTMGGSCVRLPAGELPLPLLLLVGRHRASRPRQILQLDSCTLSGLGSQAGRRSGGGSGRSCSRLLAIEIDGLSSPPNLANGGSGRQQYIKSNSMHSLHHLVSVVSLLLLQLSCLVIPIAQASGSTSANNNNNSSSSPALNQFAPQDSVRNSVENLNRVAPRVSVAVAGLAPADSSGGRGSSQSHHHNHNFSRKQHHQSSTPHNSISPIVNLTNNNDIEATQDGAQTTKVDGKLGQKLMVVNRRMTSDIGDGGSSSIGSGSGEPLPLPPSQPLPAAGQDRDSNGPRGMRRRRRRPKMVMEAAAANDDELAAVNGAPAQVTDEQEEGEESWPEIATDSNGNEEDGARMGSGRGAGKPSGGADDEDRARVSSYLSTSAGSGDGSCITVDGIDGGLSSSNNNNNDDYNDYGAYVIYDKTSHNNNPSSSQSDNKNNNNNNDNLLTANEASSSSDANAKPNEASSESMASSSDDYEDDNRPSSSFQVIFFAAMPPNKLTTNTAQGFKRSSSSLAHPLSSVSTTPTQTTISGQPNPNSPSSTPPSSLNNRTSATILVSSPEDVQVANDSVKTRELHQQAGGEDGASAGVLLLSSSSHDHPEPTTTTTTLMGPLDGDDNNGAHDHGSHDSNRSSFGKPPSHRHHHRARRHRAKSGQGEPSEWPPNDDNLDEDDVKWLRNMHKSRQTGAGLPELANPLAGSPIINPSQDLLAADVEQTRRRTAKLANSSSSNPNSKQDHDSPSTAQSTSLPGKYYYADPTNLKVVASNHQEDDDDDEGNSSSSSSTSGSITNIGLVTTTTTTTATNNETDNNKFENNDDLRLLTESTGAANAELKHNVYYWRLIWFILPVGATFGNLLVIMAVYRERTLQSVTNYFIVSLAFADLFVGLVVMPFAVYVLVNEVWELSDTICDIYVAVDVTSSTASILNLVAISIDRYRAVAYPIAYTAGSSSTIASITICGVWMISCAVGAPIIFGLNTTPGRKSDLCILYNSTYIFWSSLASFYIPCIAMIALYWRIFSAIRSRTKKAIQAGGANHTSGHLATSATAAANKNKQHPVSGPAPNATGIQLAIPRTCPVEAAAASAMIVGQVAQPIGGPVTKAPPSSSISSSAAGHHHRHHDHDHNHHHHNHNHHHHLGTKTGNQLIINGATTTTETTTSNGDEIILSASVVSMVGNNTSGALPPPSGFAQGPAQGSNGMLLEPRGGPTKFMDSDHHSHLHHDHERKADSAKSTTTTSAANKAARGEDTQSITQAAAVLGPTSEPPNGSARGLTDRSSCSLNASFWRPTNLANEPSSSSPSPDELNLANIGGLLMDKTEEATSKLGGADAVGAQEDEVKNHEHEMGVDVDGPGDRSPRLEGEAASLETHQGASMGRGNKVMELISWKDNKQLGQPEAKLGLALLRVQCCRCSHEAGREQQQQQSAGVDVELEQTNCLSRFLSKLSNCTAPMTRRQQEISAENRTADTTYHHELVGACLALFLQQSSKRLHQSRQSLALMADGKDQLRDNNDNKGENYSVFPLKYLMQPTDQIFINARLYSTNPPTSAPPEVPPSPETISTKTIVLERARLLGATTSKLNLNGFLDDQRAITRAQSTTESALPISCSSLQDLRSSIELHWRLCHELILTTNCRCLSANQASHRMAGNGVNQCCRCCGRPFIVHGGGEESRANVEPRTPLALSLLEPCESTSFCFQLQRATLLELDEFGSAGEGLVELLVASLPAYRASPRASLMLFTWAAAAACWPGEPSDECRRLRLVVQQSKQQQHPVNGNYDCCNGCDRMVACPWLCDGCITNCLIASVANVQSKPQATCEPSHQIAKQPPPSAGQQTSNGFQAPTNRMPSTNDNDDNKQTAATISRGDVKPELECSHLSLLLREEQRQVKLSMAHQHQLVVSMKLPEVDCVHERSESSDANGGRAYIIGQEDGSRSDGEASSPSPSSSSGSTNFPLGSASASASTTSGSSTNGFESSVTNEFDGHQRNGCSSRSCCRPVPVCRACRCLDDGAPSNKWHTNSSAHMAESRPPPEPLDTGWRNASEGHCDCVTAAQQESVADQQLAPPRATPKDQPNDDDDSEKPQAAPSLAVDQQQQHQPIPATDNKPHAHHQSPVSVLQTATERLKRRSMRLGQLIRGSGGFRSGLASSVATNGAKAETSPPDTTKTTNTNNSNNSERTNSDDDPYSSSMVAPGAPTTSCGGGGGLNRSTLADATSLADLAQVAADSVDTVRANTTHDNPRGLVSDSSGCKQKLVGPATVNFSMAPDGAEQDGELQLSLDGTLVQAGADSVTGSSVSRHKMGPHAAAASLATENKSKGFHLLDRVINLIQPSSGRLHRHHQSINDNRKHDNNEQPATKGPSKWSKRRRRRGKGDGDVGGGGPTVAADDGSSAAPINRHRSAGGSRRRREKNAARRERKATKTLAIVLGIFLICWTPFFTCNIIDGICIQLDMDCRPGMMVYLVTSWLGYINSCVNPIIYTIFNMEFRRAFKKILTTRPKCCSDN